MAADREPTYGRADMVDEANPNYHDVEDTVYCESNPAYSEFGNVDALEARLYDTAAVSGSGVHLTWLSCYLAGLSSCLARSFSPLVERDNRINNTNRDRKEERRKEKRYSRYEKKKRQAAEQRRDGIGNTEKRRKTEG